MRELKSTELKEGARVNALSLCADLGWKGCRSAFVLLWVALLPLSICGGVSPKMATKDGLHLVVEFEESRADNGPLIRCKVTNKTAVPVGFRRTVPTRGFAFQLFDEEGRFIEPKGDWKNRITPEALNPPDGSVRVASIEPGGSIEYGLSLSEAYGESIATMGPLRLVVEWMPGVDGAGNPYQVGTGLRIEAEMAGRSLPSIHPNVGAVERDDGVQSSVRPPSDAQTDAVQRESSDTLRHALKRLAVVVAGLFTIFLIRTAVRWRKGRRVG